MPGTWAGRQGCYGMRTIRRKGPFLVMALLLIGTGIGIGALASSLTSAALVWRAPPRFPSTAEPVKLTRDQASAGRAWARSAFDGGLRECPKMNPEFIAACQAEIKALSDRPSFAEGSYGGPLLVTTIEPVAPVPDFEPYVPEEPALPARNWREADYGAQPPARTADAPPEPTQANYPAVPDEG